MAARQSESSTEQLPRAAFHALIVLGLVLGFLALMPTAPSEAATTTVARDFNAVVDVKVIRPGNSEPDCGGGWHLDDTDLNAGVSNSPDMFLCYRLAADGLPLTALQVNYADEESEAMRCANGWELVNVDVQVDDSDEWIWICKSRSVTSTPILDVLVDRETSSGADCGPEGLWQSSGQDMNEGEGGAYVYLCWVRTQDLDKYFSRGNKGEPPADDDRTDCDAGLEESADLCVDDDRFDEEAAEFKGTWDHWALLHQREQLGGEVPLQQIVTVGSHNSYHNSVENRLLCANNQQYSVSDQLEAGMRAIEIDGVSDDEGDELQVYHEPQPGCGSRLLWDRFEEVRNWLRDNPRAVLILNFEDKVANRHHGRLGYMIDRLLDETGIGLYRPIERDKVYNAEGTFVRTVVPSQAELLKRDQRVVFLGTAYGLGVPTQADLLKYNYSIPRVLDAGGLGDGCVLPKILNDKGGVSNAGGFAPGYAAFTRVHGDLTETGDVNTPEFRRLVQCGVRIVSIDDVLDDDEDRLAAGVWSWKSDHRPTSGHAATIGADERWTSAAPSTALPYACVFKVDTPGKSSWKVTEASGPFMGGFAACETEYPGSRFGAPVSWTQNRNLSSQVTARTWLAHQDLDGDGTWSIYDPPKVTLTVENQPGATTPPLEETEVLEGLGTGIRVDIVTEGDALTVDTVDCGPGRFGSQTNVESDGSHHTFVLGCIFPASSDTPLDDVYVEASDGTGLAGRGTLAHRTVDNVAPSLDGPVVVTPAPEGSASTIEVTFTDPGADAAELRVKWGDGAGEVTEWELGTEEASFGRTVSVDHTYPDNGTYSAQLRVCDESKCDIGTAQIVVDNVAAVFTGPKALTLDEGSSSEVTFTLSDPGFDCPSCASGGTTERLSATVAWDGGPAAAATVTHVPGAAGTPTVASVSTKGPSFANQGPHTATVTFRDDDTPAASAATATVPVTVRNVPPEVTIAGSGKAVEGSGYEVTATITDPGVTDTIEELHVDWGDGTPVQPERLGAPGERKQSHTYADDGQYDVRIWAIDNDGGQSAKVLHEVVVANADPELRLAEVAGIEEGSTATLSGTMSDAGIFDELSLAIRWGDGSQDQVGPFPAGTSTFTVEHRYLDDEGGDAQNGVFPVRVTLTDGDGGEASTTTPVAVSNVAPAVTITGLEDQAGVSIADGDRVALTGLPVEVRAAFTDPGPLDTHTATIDWGDGSPVAAPATGEVSGSHIYAAAGDRTITVAVADDDSGVGRAQVALTVVDPAGAVGSVTERVQDILAGDAIPSRAARQLEKALGQLQGRNAGKAANGADTLLEKGNAVAAMKKLDLAIRALAGAGDEPRIAELQSLLALAIKSEAVGAVADAAAAADSAGDTRQVARAQSDIAAGDTALAEGDIPTAIDHWQAAVRALAGTR